ncbi:Hypothetical predicted protein [Mytilus galloprovincialis]|uniref:EF-hand domain-containing protein n=1 Tax=Mytilus galloprovincialis TaxID=29158 RepID=A0A8B6FTJ2_MYTGA|nr:Hypothetical predicted protein [Mytilus galloprovincialis]
MVTIQLVLVCVLLTCCFAFPGAKKMSDMNLSETVKHAVKDINKRGAYKRKMSKLEAEIEAFSWTDADGNGSISPQEWANFYSTLEDERLPKYSYNLWLRSFYNQITEPGFDKNNNGLMELGEYLLI